MLGMVAALALQASSAPPVSLTLGDLQARPGLDLAQELLPAGAGEQVVGGRVGPSGPPGLYSAFWWLSAKPAAPALCRRIAYHTSMHPVDWSDQSPAAPMAVGKVEALTQYAPSYPVEASDARCAELQGWVNTRPEDEKAKLAMLTRLVQAIGLASKTRKLPFEATISCESHTPGSCPSAREALRDLPLTALYDVRLKTNRYTDEPVAKGVRVRYALPPSDGVYRQAEIAFGPAKDVSSWFVMIEGEDRIDKMTIRRAMVVYH